MNWPTSSSARDLLGGDLVALGVEAADEADLVEQVLGRVGDEVEDAVFLPDARCQHIGESYNTISPDAAAARAQGEEAR